MFVCRQWRHSHGKEHFLFFYFLFYVYSIFHVHLFRDTVNKTPCFLTNLTNNVEQTYFVLSKFQNKKIYFVAIHGFKDASSRHVYRSLRCHVLVASPTLSIPYGLSPSATLLMPRHSRFWTAGVCSSPCSIFTSA